MGALPVFAPHEAEPKPRELPDYLPARMVNEFVYCPRLFFYEWVDAVFRESVDTIEGKIQHQRVDARSTELPEPSKLEAAHDDKSAAEKIHSRSVTLSSERLRVIAKMDLVEASEGVVTPVDYKHGRPRDNRDGLELWPADRAQLAIQGLLLREAGYRCEEGIAYYAKTKQRVRVLFDDALIGETERIVAEAWALAIAGQIPPPLVDSPKCQGCSLVGICLPDETNTLLARSPLDGALQLSLFSAEAPRKPMAREVRQLVTPRDDRKPLYLNSQGFRVGKTGEVLQVKDKDQLQQEVRIGEICQVNLLGNVQVSTQAVQTLCESDIPICYFSQGSWFYGITTGINSKNVFLRRSQFRLAEQEWFALSLARRIVAGKIRNQRTLLQRNHQEPRPDSLLGLRQMAEQAERARNLEELLGIEGNAARIYFGDFAGMIKVGDKATGFSGETGFRGEPDDWDAPSGDSKTGLFHFDFTGRNRRPPRDAVNALLSLAYSLLAKDLTIACYAVGFDPYMGFYHQPRFGRPALALDLMEPFRPLIADSAVLNAINNRMVTPGDFVQAGPGVALTPNGRKGFFRAYELRMDTLVTHPLFEYRVSYRRLLEIQARLLARVFDGEIAEYPVFVTR
jgi:CRISP-associated protein Cas1